jgi:hypothetical protein
MVSASLQIECEMIRFGIFQITNVWNLPAVKALLTSSR